MKYNIYITIYAAIFFLNLNLVFAQTNNIQRADLPHLQQNQGAIQLLVDGKPFLMIAGELHNSSSSTPTYFNEAIKYAKEMNINTLIASVAWEQLEPKENQFDFSLLDHIIKSAHDNNLKLVVIWFGSWKNGESSYMPLWVKTDTKRFFRIKDQYGNSMSAVSPFCSAAMKADAKAFKAMMQHIKLKNQFNDVVMVQVENEVGAFTDIDHNETALKLYRSTVPEKLTQYLIKSNKSLDPYLSKSWKENGTKTKGSWAELFGERNLIAQHLFMTWQYASYIEEIAKQGKAAYNLPMFVNAWQEQSEEELPGSYPNGGPVSKVIDIYQLAAPSIDFIAPDIYLPNFKEICGNYFKPEKNNPLFVPECERTNPGKAYYVFAENDALGFGPFGIESLINDFSYAQSNLVLNELLPLIAQYQGTKNMRGILQESGEDSTVMQMGNYKLTIKYTSEEKKSYGIIIQTGKDEFIVAGINMQVFFSSLNKNTQVNIGEVLEGKFQEDKWETLRQLNGDETYHNTRLIVDSRYYAVVYENGNRIIKPVLTPIAVLNQSLEKELKVKQVKSPAIYKVKLYAVVE